MYNGKGFVAWTMIYDKEWNEIICKLFVPGEKPICNIHAENWCPNAFVLEGNGRDLANNVYLENSWVFTTINTDYKIKYYLVIPLDNGLCVKYYPNGNIFSIGSKPYGQYTEYHDNGSPMMVSNCNKNGNLNGIYREFDPDGHLRIDAYYDDGILCRQTYHRKFRIADIYYTLVGIF